MKFWKYIVLIILCVLYITVQVFRFNGIPLPHFINSYLTDLLCMPIVMGIIVIILQKIYQFNNLIVGFNLVTLLTLFFALFFEITLPLTSSEYVQDYNDIIAYFFGAYVFFFAQYSSLNLNSTSVIS